MKLIRLDGRTVNLSLVQVYTDLDGGRIELEFSSGSILAVEGAEAAALHDFLKSRSISLASDSEPRPGPGGFLADDAGDDPDPGPDVLPKPHRADEGA